MIMNKKKLFPILILAMLSTIAWQGCTETEVQKGSVEFGMNPLADDALKSAEINRYDVVGALVSIVGEDGDVIYDKEFLNFYTFGSSFVTEKLKLETGHYLLTEFLLVDSSRNILWATPLEGSSLAYLVDDPLPMNFSIQPNNTTQLRPQVVWVGNYNPGDFGYVNFDVEFVSGFCLAVFYESGCDDWYYDSIRPMLTGDFRPIYASKFLVYAGNELIKEEMIMPGYNKIGIPKGYKQYTFVVTDCNQEKCFVETFNSEELRQFSCREGEALYIDCSNGQPGDLIITPERITEPTIKQGVFGLLTEPFFDTSAVDTGNNIYEFLPVVREVHLYKIDNYEDIWEMIETDSCNVYPLFDRMPDVRVLSNSGGYFQAELEAGIYLYMVLIDSGYYIDLMISSRRPGIFKVEHEKVTELKIMIQPCYFWD